MFLLGFRRKLNALALCKSIESAIQWFQIHHRITFATIQSPAVYLLGARVSIFSTLVPRLFSTMSTFNSKFFNLCSKISRVISLVTLELGIACLFLLGLLIGEDGNVQLSCVL